MKNKTLTQLANQIITLRSSQRGGVVSAPAMPFFPDDHLLGEYTEPTCPRPYHLQIRHPHRRNE
jgi:hypothetical protein